MRIAPDVLDQIKQRTSLLDEVRAVVPAIKKKGKYWWACCPFHNEKTASFHVREDQGNYYCFGCGASGDAIHFVQETRGGNFMDTVQYLADKAGITLPKFEHNPEAEKNRNDGFKVLERSQVYFERNLSGDAQKYTQKRQLTKETLKTFGIGYASDSWNNLRDEMLTEGFSTDVLRATGMVIESDKGKGDYDRFRDRLMFPIHDLRDRVVAFGGRIMGKGEPKYLNSPETPFFNKSNLLYNLNRARNHIKQEGIALLVEGYMDAVSLWQKGVRTAVAPMGTAVTPSQIHLLWKYHSAPIVCLDGDKAGQNAAIRLAHKILEIITPGKTLRFMWLPEGEDPDTFIQARGKKAFLEAIQTTFSIEDVLWRNIIQGCNLQTGDGRAKVEATIKELGRIIKDDTIRRHYTKSWKDNLWNSSRNNKNYNPQPGKKGWVPKLQGENGARLLLALLCKNPQLLEKFDEKISDISFENQEDKNILSVLLRAHAEKKLEVEKFNTYLTSCRVNEAIGILCKETMVNKTCENEKVEDVFNRVYKNVQARQQARAQVSCALKELRDADLTKDEAALEAQWKKLKSLQKSPQDDFFKE